MCSSQHFIGLDAAEATNINHSEQHQEFPDSAKPFFNNFQPITWKNLFTIYLYLKNYLFKLKSNNASGSDDITGKALKYCREEILAPLYPYHNYFHATI